MRRALGAFVAALGIILVVLGSWMVVMLGPSGAARFSATSKAPGVIVVTPDVLNAVNVPVRITATRRDGGAVRVVAAPSIDARSILASSAVSTVADLRYPAGTLELRRSGTGALADVSTADVWRLATKRAGTAQLVVDQGRGPEMAVVTSGDDKPLTDVTVTLVWADKAWFFEALAAATIGAVMAAFAFSDMWQSRAIAAHDDVAHNPTPEVVV
jgi:hypothetical protein